MPLTIPELFNYYADISAAAEATAVTPIEGQGSEGAGGSPQDPGSEPGNDGNHTHGISGGALPPWASGPQNTNMPLLGGSPVNPGSPANSQSHGNSPDLLPAADPTHGGDHQDHAQTLHLHFAHMWTA